MNFTALLLLASTKCCSLMGFRLAHPGDVSKHAQLGLKEQAYMDIHQQQDDVSPCTYTSCSFGRC